MNGNELPDDPDEDRTGYDPTTGTYHARHEWDNEQSLVTTVVTAVAAVTNADPTDLPPLYETVDPDALDGSSSRCGRPVAQSGRSGSPTTAVSSPSRPTAGSAFGAIPSTTARPGECPGAGSADARSDPGVPTASGTAAVGRRRSRAQSQGYSPPTVQSALQSVDGPVEQRP